MSRDQGFSAFFEAGLHSNEPPPGEEMSDGEDEGA